MTSLFPSRHLLRRCFAWLLGVINQRTDCPECGGFRTGILIGEWGEGMRECSECKHFWLVPTGQPKWS